MSSFSTQLDPEKCDLLGKITETFRDFTPNKFGHDRNHLRFIAPNNPHHNDAETDDFGHTRKSHFVYDFNEKVRCFLMNPVAFPELGYVKSKRVVKRNGGLKRQVRRSYSRENLANFCVYLANHADFITGKVGIRAWGRNGEFKCYDRDHAATVTGMTKEALRVCAFELEKLGMLKRKRVWAKNEDGTYAGRPSIYTLKDAFWDCFGMLSEFQSMSGYAYSKALKKANGIIKKVAQGLKTNMGHVVEDELERVVKNKTTSKKRQLSKDNPEYYRVKFSLSESQYREMTLAAIEIVRTSDGSLSKETIYAQAFETLRL